MANWGDFNGDAKTKLYDRIDEEWFSEPKDLETSSPTTNLSKRANGEAFGEAFGDVKEDWFSEPNKFERNRVKSASREPSRESDDEKTPISDILTESNHDMEDLVKSLEDKDHNVGGAHSYEDRLGSESEEESILRRDERNLEEPGSTIRQEAREELIQVQNSPRRPNSLYNEDAPSPQQLKNVFREKRNSLFDSNNKSTGQKDHLYIKKECANKTSREKLMNGRSPKEDKQVHHVQFNKDSKQGSEIPHPSPSASISTSTSSSSEDNSSLAQFSEARPPDGGWGWVVVAASFMVNLIADGITFSFGVIYVEFLNYFGEGKSKTAWIGSLFMAMPLLSGPVASFLTDRYGCRRVSIAGSILATTGFVISSFANSMGVLIVTFGIVSGFGLSLCYVAAVVIVAYYFEKRRSFATGLSVCGSGIGTFIFAPLTQYLLKEYGWRGTTLILAGLFLNLAVCGCLMRDLEWTTTRAKAKTEERRKNRERKRTKMQSSSADSFSASSSANTNTNTNTNTNAHTPHDLKRSFASANAMPVDRNNEEEDGGKLFSSLVTLPTFVKNGEQVPLEVLELLSTHKNVYNVLLQNYPSLLIPSRSFSDSGRLNDQLSIPPAKFESTPSPLGVLMEGSQNDEPSCPEENTDAAYLGWLKKTQKEHLFQRAATMDHPRRLHTAYLKDIRVHRHSLTYRGAMLNINRYRLRASSCPDIYRNSMTTIAKTKMVWYAGLWEFWDLLVDMLDFSHFADTRFLLFAISNFLLYTWYDVPYVYLTDNAIEMGFSEQEASILISLIGIVNMVGEILLGWAGDKAWVNASMVYAICMGLCGTVTAMIPMVVNNYYALCAISGSFGLFIAANYSLTSIILVELITLERFTNAYGLLLLVQGIANLVGPPLAGWLYDITGTYDLSFYLAGLFIALSGVLLVMTPIVEQYRKWETGRNPQSEKREFKNLNNV